MPASEHPAGPGPKLEGTYARTSSWWQQKGKLLLGWLLLAMLIFAPVLWTSPRYQTHMKRSRFTVNIKGERIFAAALAGPGDGMQRTKKKARAAILVLARNQDCEAVLRSMKQMEARFNARFAYPYVFLNNSTFSGAFVNRTSAATAARTMYGQVPPEHWGFPEWISAEQAAAAKADMRRRGVLYGARESYHHMCRYFSGFAHWHPLLAEFDFYWRMEPDVHYYCDLDYDPFLYMQDRGLKYGFVITVLELANTIPSLWTATQSFMRAFKDLVPEANLLGFMTGENGSYNLCHFWSNFEVVDLSFFRSEAYTAYFAYLDRTGGFFLERWGDAPVHSLAVAMFLNSSQVHFFQDIGYRHNSMKHCPAVQRNRCHCDAMEAVSFHSPSFGICHKHWRSILIPKSRTV